MKKSFKTFIFILLGLTLTSLILLIAYSVYWKYEVSKLPEPYRNAVERSCSPTGGCGCLKEAKELAANNTPIPNPTCPDGFQTWYPMCEGLAYCSRKLIE